MSGELRLGGIGRHDDEEIIRRLTTVWGIGEWTAQMFLIFKLGRLDVMPAGDLGVHEGLRVLDGLDERPLAPPISLDSRLAKTAGPERKGRDGPEAEGEQGDRRS